MLGAEVSSEQGRSAPDLRRLKDNLREIRRMRREHMLTERMRDAIKRANCCERDSEGEINRKKARGESGIGYVCACD